jgi:hypothetical protein
MDTPTVAGRVEVVVGVGLVVGVVVGGGLVVEGDVALVVGDDVALVAGGPVGTVVAGCVPEVTGMVPVVLLDALGGLGVELLEALCVLVERRAGAGPL